MSEQSKIPVTVLTGYLGAGKTTLLNRILSEQHGKKYAVIVNEIGEIGIDNDIIVGSDEEIFEMNNGCICCTVRGDLIRVISGLLRRAKGFDGILIETTGIADPAPVAQTFFADPDIAAKTTIDSIVTVVDAKHLPLRLKDSSEAEDQIAFADIIVLNKADLVSANELEEVEATIRDINNFARIIRSEKCQVPLNEVLGLGSFNLEKILEHSPEFLQEEKHEHLHACNCGCSCGHHDHHHNKHHHDSTISTVSLTSDKPLDQKKFEAWIGNLNATKGQDLLRYKGILNISGNDNRLVLQGVHMMMEGNISSPWPKTDKRQSRLVFIGRNLNEAELMSGFALCEK